MFKRKRIKKLLIIEIVDYDNISLSREELETVQDRIENEIKKADLHTVIKPIILQGPLNTHLIDLK